MPNRNTNRNADRFYKKRLRSRNRPYTVVTYSFLALFLAMCVYLVYFVQFRGTEFSNSSYNVRLQNLSKYTIRGDIMTSDGVVVATTNVAEDGSEYRSYPLANTYAHVVGYDTHGMAGAELEANYYLLTSHDFILNRITNQVLDNKNVGDDVVLTVDSNLQQTVYDAMGSYDGAVICMEPSTGKILAMVSKPDYNPNNISQNYDSLSSDSESSVLLNRATLGKYTPGSTFKIFTLMSFLQNASPQEIAAFNYECQGVITEDDYSLQCYNGMIHGSEDLMAAFGNSCNGAFAKIGMEVGASSLKKTCEEMGFNSKITSSLSYQATSDISVSNSDTTPTLMQTSIGQSTTLVNPMHMAVVASAICNGGSYKAPYVIDHVQNADGNVVRTFRSKRTVKLLDPEDATAIQPYLRNVVTNGTATPLYSDAYEAYGKTGTAEYSDDKSKAHSWFVGYAKDASGKELVIAVVCEGVSSSYGTAVPITKTVFDSYFSQ